MKTQACGIKSRVPEEEFHTITMAKLQEAQEIQGLEGGGTVPGNQTLNSTDAAQAVCSDTTMNFQKKHIYFGDSTPLLSLSLVYFLSNVAQRVSKFKYKIVHFFILKKIFMMTLQELMLNLPTTVIPCIAFCFTDILYCTHVLYAVDCQ